MAITWGVCTVSVVMENTILPAGEPGTAISPVQREPNLHPRVLMVEDDSFIRQLTTEALGLCGYEVDGAGDGAAAWDALNAGSYDLMITDNSMPKLTGLELLEKMRAARMELPVIMATSVLPMAEFNRSPWLQPAATLVKPYTIAELMGVVSEVLCAAEDARRQIAPPPTPPGPPSGGTVPAAIDPDTCAD